MGGRRQATTGVRRAIPACSSKRDNRHRRTAMGIFKGVIKTAIAVKAVDFIRREASKPENQRKAKEMVGKVSSRVNSAKSQ
jgi:hypothetical protein